MHARRIAILFMIVFLFIFPLLQVEASAAPTPVGDIYVQDFADVLTKEQKTNCLNLEHT
ncbi:hypothetical protein ACI2OX_11480 [Bacillus sp. N9]